MEALTVGSVLIALGAIAGVVVSFGKIKKSFKEEVKAETELAIKNAHELAKADLIAFSGKLEMLERSIDSLDDKFEREVDYIKNTYNSEIRNLTGKIEELREEIRNSHSSLIQLLTQMVKDK